MAAFLMDIPGSRRSIAGIWARHSGGFIAWCVSATVLLRDLMTKADIVQAVYSRLGGFSKKESADLVDLVFETIKETLGRGEKIKVSGFGNFVLRDKRQRQGRNPQTGEPITITERRVLSFRASHLLKQALNEELESVFAAAVAGASEPTATLGARAKDQP
jgi:integration host factor subunit alpha